MGKGVLIDTDVLIEYIKGRRELPSDPRFISEITLYEFIRGTKDSYEAKKLLEEDFIVIFHDNDILRNAAEMWKKLRSQGKLVDDRDLLIAATSISRDLPLLTGNSKHFERLKEFGLKFYGNIAK